MTSSQALRVSGISIHAPHTGSDLASIQVSSSTIYFNPRSPYGKRLRTPRLPNHFRLFQSTLPIRGATQKYLKRCWVSEISIHAPHTGSDTTRAMRSTSKSDFNPRSPYGERPAEPDRRGVRHPISIHAPHTGSDPPDPASGYSNIISIHAPHAGSDTMYSS